jgi:hypothetical protein
VRDPSDLRAAQQRAATRFYEHDAVQAVMPMGSGKTASALTAIRELIDDGAIECAVVLAPKRVAQLVWTREHLLWSHLAGLRVRLVSGTPVQRNAALFDIEMEPADIYVVGVDNTQWLVDLLKPMRRDHKLFGLLVIDESSRFKNPRGKRGRALQKIADRWTSIWELTGTPRPNGYEDQYRPLQIITKGKLWNRSFDRWRGERFMPLDFHQRSWSIRPEWRERTKADIATYSFTVSDEDMPELEPVTSVFHWVDLPPTVAREYKRMEHQLLAKDGRRTVLAANQAVASGKLAQMANGFVYDEAGGVVDLHTEKADQLVELLEGSDENVLIGYEFRQDLATLRALWPDLPYLGAGVKDDDALRYETAWNRGELPRLALHPASAGHGLNLQYGGSQLVWFGMPWSAELYDQTLKRFHRPGQTRRCFAHHILARNTVDEVKYDRVINKMSEQEAFRRYLEKI